MHKTNLIEIFSSIQGEGKYVGCRQIFIRFADCNLNCKYCDTNFKNNNFFNIYVGDNKIKRNNPASVDEIINVINELSADVPVHSISFTGGEPLLHADFIKFIADKVETKIFLETNGTLTDKLKNIIDSIDIISMDIKLPTATGINLFEQHYKFISVAKEKDLYVKIVISGETTQEEFLTAVDTINSVDKNILLILQPVTPVNNVKAAPIDKILQFQQFALKLLTDVRIIPQTHKMLNLT